MHDDRICDDDAITTRELLAGFDRSSAAVGAAQRRHLAFISRATPPGCGPTTTAATSLTGSRCEMASPRGRASAWWPPATPLSLPAISRALEDGVLSLDKVVELTRFATPDDEDDLIAWAGRVAPAAIRERADAARRVSDEELRQNRWRELRWWWEDDGSRMSLWGSLPADKGAVVAKALDRLAEHIPELPDDVPSWTEDGPSTIDARRADALVAMASATIAQDHDPDRATLVVHAELPALTGDGANGVIAGGPAIAPQVVQRLACDCRLQAVLHGHEGGIDSIGTTSRNIPPWLRRQVEHRDGYRCTFPGCGAKRFVEVHHIVPWPKGPTEIGNLLCACSFHHHLLHLHGWHAGLGADGAARWFRPDWTPYEPRPAPSTRRRSPASIS